METKFKLNQHVLCTRQGSEEPEIGVIAEVAELDALCEDEEGRQWEENTYMVMLHNESGKMVFEEFLESDLEEVPT
jgi:hypothetical protein